MAIFISYWGQCFTLFFGFIPSVDCQPNVWPSTCLLGLQGRLKLTKYYVKYLSEIYEYLPIDNNAFLVGIS